MLRSRMSELKSKVYRLLDYAELEFEIRARE